MLAFNDETAPHQVAFESYGTQLRVCATSAELLERLMPFLPPGWKAVPPAPTQHRLGILQEDDGTYSLYNAGVRFSEGQSLELSLVVLDGQIRGHVALETPDKTFIHAGAVAHEGRGIIFPGSSFSGKTTLVAALVRAGATYYSDEFAVFDAEGRLHPYAKPLSLRDDPPTAQTEYPVEELGGVAGTEPLPLGMAAITHYRPGGTWQPEQLSPGAAALRLLSHTVTARARPDRAMQAIVSALEGAVAFEGERGEADEMARELLKTVHA